MPLNAINIVKTLKLVQLKNAGIFNFNSPTKFITSIKEYKKATAKIYSINKSKATEIIKLKVQADIKLNFKNLFILIL